MLFNFAKDTYFVGHRRDFSYRKWKQAQENDANIRICNLLETAIKSNQACTLEQIFVVFPYENIERSRGKKIRPKDRRDTFS